MRRIRLLPLVPLMVAWLMLVGSVSTMDIVFALLVSLVVLWLFPMPPLFSTVHVHPWGVVRLAARFLADLARASVWVAWLSIRPRPVGRGSLIDVTLRLDDDLRRTIVAELTSLVPGTVVIDLDQQTSVMTMHVLDVTDPELLARERASVHALEGRVERALSVSQRGRGPGATEATLATHGPTDRREN